MKIIFITLILFLNSFAQVKIISQKIIPLPKTENWHKPIFSKNGNALYFTNDSFGGIWKYDLTKNKLNKISGDAGSGYQFSISEDEKNISYRTTNNIGNERIQKIISIDLNNLKKNTKAQSNDLTTPKYIGNELWYLNNSKKQEPKINSSNFELLGIEKGKIYLLINGKRIKFDPIENGEYIWASLSPSNEFILAYETSIGTFIANKNGEVISKLGRKNSPVWVNNNWILFMDDKDDGEKLISSDLKIISFDGKNEIYLAETKSIHEMYPSVNQLTNQIVSSTSDGQIIIYKYEIQ